MYHAGKKDIPAEGRHAERISNHLYDILSSLDLQSAMAGDPALMTSMLRVGGDVYDVVRGAVKAIDHCASAVIKTADDFRTHDQQAARDYQALSDDLKHTRIPTHQQSPELADPEAPGSTYTPRGLPHPASIQPSTPDPSTPGDHPDNRATGDRYDKDIPTIRPQGSPR